MCVCMHMYVSVVVYFVRLGHRRLRHRFAADSRFVLCMYVCVYVFKFKTECMYVWRCCVQEDLQLCWLRAAAQALEEPAHSAAQRRARAQVRYYVCMYVHIICTYLCMLIFYVCMYVCLYFMYVLYAYILCMYVCTYCMYVCMHAFNTWSIRMYDVCMTFSLCMHVCMFLVHVYLVSSNNPVQPTL